VLSAKGCASRTSSFFGGQRSMASIDAAVALIGVQALTRLIVACGVSSSFKDIPGIDLPVFWRDALVAATAAQALAARLGAEQEEAYVCGLLHATGHLILCQTYPEIAHMVFAGFAVVRGAELAAIENDNFGIDHPSVGALWIESIGFPQAVADTIGKATQPPVETDGPLDLSLRSACLLAQAVAQGLDAEAAWHGLPQAAQRRLSAADGQPDAAFDKLYAALKDTAPMS